MPGVITMPALSDTMGAGRLVKWTKKTGDKIKKGDLIAEVETDKAVMDVEAFQDGYLSGPLADEGTEAPVGQIIGYIADSLNDVRTVDSATPVAPRPDEDGGVAEKPAADKPAVSTVLAASMATMRPTPARRPVASAQVSPPGSHPAAVGPQRARKKSAGGSDRGWSAISARARVRSARGRRPHDDCKRRDADFRVTAGIAAEFGGSPGHGMTAILHAPAGARLCADHCSAPPVQCGLYARWASAPRSRRHRHRGRQRR